MISDLEHYEKLREDTQDEIDLCESMMAERRKTIAELEDMIVINDEEKERLQHRLECYQNAIDEILRGDERMEREVRL